MAKRKAAPAETWRGSDDLRPLLVPIGSVAHDPANVRRHSERNREAIRASLMRFGQMKPVVIDRDGIVRAGNGTLSEARELGWTHVAATRSDLTTTDLVGYAIADNRTAELADWDTEALTATLKALEAENYDLDATGYNSAELDELIGSLGSSMEGLGDSDEGDDPAASPAAPNKSLAERFGVPPFSVLDARQGYWQDRKRAWLALGIQSELGRGGDLMDLSGPMDRKTEYGGGR